MSVSVSPSFGFFLADGLELSLEPSVGIVSGGGTTSVTLAGLIGLGYNFDTGGSVYPFLSAIGGVIRAPGDIVRGAVGAEMGVKFALGSGGLISPRIQLVAIPTDPLILTLTTQLGVSVFF